MIDYSNASIDKISVHHVGNQTNGESMHLSKELLNIRDARLRELLMKFFLSPFNNHELYSFTFSNGDFSMNPLYKYASVMLEKEQKFHAESVHIAKQLFEVATHPQIKAGDLFVVHFSNIDLNGEQMDAIGIFKSENKQPFLKVEQAGEEFAMNYEEGISIEKLEKGALILDTFKEDGFRILVVDKGNKSADAQYWKDDFLKIKPYADNYHHTKNFLDVYKGYVTDRLPQDFEVNKTDQIDLLNKSMDYFKANDQFSEKEFTKTILEDEDVIKSFQQYKQEYEIQHAVEVEDQFDISSPALKKQSRVFKSVLKLDKNFHVYIHGKRELIEQGVETDGRKYYKIYYENEM